MNNKLSTFQAVFFVVMILIILSSVAIVALTKNKAKNGVAVELNMWGTIDSDIFNQVQNEINERDKKVLNIKYVQVNPKDFETKFIEALADGKGPDLVLLSDDLFIRQEKRLFEIPYQSLPQADFKNTYVEAGEFLLTEKGVMGLPYIIDPLVMYWNRTTLNQNGIPFPPKKWDEFMNLVPKLTVIDEKSKSIIKSGVALGEFRNIKNAKEIFINFVQQAGNSIIIRKPVDSNSENKFSYESIFAERLGYSVSPANAAINFFTQFSDPEKEIYSWNRSLPNSDEMFLSGDLAFYFGFASEFKSLRERNPNLNFDVTVIPQSSGTSINSVYGKMHILSVVKNSQKVAAAFNAIQILNSKENSELLSQTTNLPSVRRDLLVNVPNSNIGQNINASSLISKVFLDPDTNKTKGIFSDMIEGYVSGRMSLSQAIDNIDTQINLLLK